MKNLRTPHSKLPTYNVIGLMSGTSLDGLDVAFCRLTPNPSPQGEGSFTSPLNPLSIWRGEKGKGVVWGEAKILAAKTFSYSKEWKEKLSTIENKSAQELAQLHSEYGHFIGTIVKKFIAEFPLSIGEGRGEVFVSSHGHTIFHQPKKKFTLQIGNGAAIAAECGLPVVCDFRTTDVALGGQGAPLVPIGDKLLFGDYDFCLNIGGITNISRKGAKTQRIFAYDICPANIVLNFLAKKLGEEFDKDGAIAKSGKVNEKLLKELNELKYYSLKPPKSLGKEWIVKNFIPILNKHNFLLKDKMRTVVEHIALQISSQFGVWSSETVQSSKVHSRILITGGGAHNKFLIERIKNLTLTLSKGEGKMEIVIPDKFTIDFKEALIFAFLGVLRWRRENNCLASVTGAKKDNCGGAIYLP